MNLTNNKYMGRRTIQLIVIILLATFTGINAQVIKKEVYVVSSFKPEVADADKISNLPSMTDTASSKIKTDYTVLPSHLKTSYNLRPIKPATMVGTPLDKLYKSYLNLGIGNYTTPVVDFSIHNLRSKEYAIGAYLFHKSSYSNLDLTQGYTVPAGYGINNLKAYGKYFFKKATWSGDIGVNTHRLRYYGANIDDSLIYASFRGIETKDIKQSYTGYFGQTSIYSTVVDSNTLRYSLGIGGEYFTDYFSNKEPHFNLNASMSKIYKGFLLGANVDYDNYTLTPKDSSKNYKNNILSILPFAEKRTELWDVKLALKLYFQDSISVYPELNFRFQAIPKALLTYFGVTSYIENNNYQSISNENPYVLPGIHVRNALHQYVLYGGLEGQLSSKAMYHFDVRLDNIQNMHFFVKDTLTPYENHFDAVYDDVTLIKYYGEISWMPLTNLTFLAKSNYYSYKLNNSYHMTPEKKPWQLANYDLTFAARFTYKEKIFTEIEYNYIGKRDAKNSNDPANPYVLKAVNDLNLKIEYKYSKTFSAYLHFYNLLSQKYYLWNQYPCEKINFLLGLTYKF
jgi:hypothetical protein